MRNGITPSMLNSSQSGVVTLIRLRLCIVALPSWILELGTRTRRVYRIKQKKWQLYLAS